MSTDPTYVVGVDWSVGSNAAVRWAAREAHRDGARLRLVHVVPSYVPISPMAPLVPLDLDDAGETLLTQARATALEVLREDVVTTSLLAGPRIQRLVDTGREAALLVLGHERGPSLDRILTGTTVTAVAARASCPVVAVSADHVAPAPRGQVLVGIKSTEHSHRLLRRGFELASQRGDRLLVLHAWELGRVYDDLVLDRADTSEWESRARDAIGLEVAPLLDQHPHVELEVRVVHGQPARVLCDATHESDLVLLARRPRAFPVGHIGSTARALLRHSACPVEIEPQADESPGVQQLQLEHDGALLR
ncbi:universal stress protein [Nocardioides aurantiacus]|uniref:Nucleotide-binding universal stress UspA family protein n=1 Tax=Nocardioides aurantiacus TaxID=86796 RepID=A0A3N2CUG1_9ACTN|nr:universal stress protein [Nocardioides aurantiacus]ROR90854.1 nucleotide-binding universal stress UspA family protein [Nocardioides aurantiacus]